MTLDLGRGRFRVKGDVLEIGPAYEDRIIRIEFFGDEIDAIRYVDPVTGRPCKAWKRSISTPPSTLSPRMTSWRQPAGHSDRAPRSTGGLRERRQTAGSPAPGAAHPLRPGDVAGGGLLQRRGKLRPPPGRTPQPGAPPECLIDYFPKDWLLVIDESHVTIPQIRAMYNGDRPGRGC
jgi:excinuclease ABC subunit B